MPSSLPALLPSGALLSSRGEALVPAAAEADDRTALGLQSPSGPRGAGLPPQQRSVRSSLLNLDLRRISAARLAGLASPTAELPPSAAAGAARARRTPLLTAFSERFGGMVGAANPPGQEEAPAVAAGEGGAGAAAEAAAAGGAEASPLRQLAQGPDGLPATPASQPTSQVPAASEQRRAYSAVVGGYSMRSRSRRRRPGDVAVPRVDLEQLVEFKLDLNCAAVAAAYKIAAQASPAPTAPQHRQRAGTPLAELLRAGRPLATRGTPAATASSPGRVSTSDAKGGVGEPSFPIRALRFGGADEAEGWEPDTAPAAAGRPADCPFSGAWPTGDLGLPVRRYTDGDADDALAAPTLLEGLQAGRWPPRRHPGWQLQSLGSPRAAARPPRPRLRGHQVPSTSSSCWRWWLRCRRRWPWGSPGGMRPRARPPPARTRCRRCGASWSRCWLT